jgi:polysaccharide deacetylase family sporulation protein PdaB
MKTKQSLWLVCIFLLVVGHLTPLAAKTNRVLPIYSVYTEDKVVSLTFDVAWGDEDMSDILETLEKENVKATFFIVGDWARKYPDWVKEIDQRGHDIANHSDKHPHMASMTKEEIKKDILDAHVTIRQLIGKDIHLFRAPYGEYNNKVVEAATECNYYTLQWDVDSLDWKEYGLNPLIRKVLLHKNLGPGSIILLHTGTKFTKDALGPIIQGLKEKGFTFLPASELILKENYKIDSSGRQYPVK